MASGAFAAGGGRGGLRTPNGKLKVTIGPETEVLDPPHGKDISVQMVADLRRMLAQTGLGPAGGPALSDQRSRDYGDSRWGEPGS